MAVPRGGDLNRYDPYLLELDNHSLNDGFFQVFYPGFTVSPLYCFTRFKVSNCIYCAARREQVPHAGEQVFNYK